MTAALLQTLFDALLQICKDRGCKLLQSTCNGALPIGEHSALDEACTGSLAQLCSGCTGLQIERHAAPISASTNWWCGSLLMPGLCGQPLGCLSFKYLQNNDTPSLYVRPCAHLMQTAFALVYASLQLSVLRVDGDQFSSL